MFTSYYGRRSRFASILAVSVSATFVLLSSCGKNAHVTGGDFALLDEELDPRPSVTPNPTSNPSGSPSGTPTGDPSQNPTGNPSVSPSGNPSGNPSVTPTSTATPSSTPSTSPSTSPTTHPSSSPTTTPSTSPTISPTSWPTTWPSVIPTGWPSGSPTTTPSSSPTSHPSSTPTHPPCHYVIKTKTFKAWHHAIFSKKIESDIIFPKKKLFGEILEALVKTENKIWDVTDALLEPGPWKDFYCKAKPVDCDNVTAQLEFQWPPLESCHGKMLLKLTWSELKCASGVLSEESEPMITGPTEFEEDPLDFLGSEELGNP